MRWGINNIFISELLVQISFCRSYKYIGEDNTDIIVFIMACLVFVTFVVVNSNFCQVFCMLLNVYVPFLFFLVHVSYLSGNWKYPACAVTWHMLGGRSAQMRLLGDWLLKQCDCATAMSLQRNCAVFLWVPGHLLVQQTSRLDRTQHCTHVLISNGKHRQLWTDMSTSGYFGPHQHAQYSIS